MQQDYSEVEADLTLIPVGTSNSRQKRQTRLMTTDTIPLMWKRFLVFAVFTAEQPLGGIVVSS